ncbi:hypothetical protein PS2_024 [Serratia phage PS2]|uniref:Uncharacterized protein n=1 Tax=Serratia phage PS2 TaxID=1481112 RepID=A0A023W4W0_9CAUD|nr:hypothetical protein FF83_gp024 [Serratia phage PS2]AHY25275.1 hypothetical protein PS2_024 [Serratia phage PS2]
MVKVKAGKLDPKTGMLDAIWMIDEAHLPKKQSKPEHVNVGTIGRVNSRKTVLGMAVSMMIGPKYSEIS